MYIQLWQVSKDSGQCMHQFIVKNKVFRTMETNEIPDRLTNGIYKNISYIVFLFFFLIEFLCSNQIKYATGHIQSWMRK